MFDAGFYAYPSFVSPSSTLFLPYPTVPYRTLLYSTVLYRTHRDCTAAALISRSRCSRRAADRCSWLQRNIQIWISRHLFRQNSSSIEISTRNL